MAKFNLGQKKVKLTEAQARIQEKTLSDDRSKFDANANDDTGNLDWLLRKNRKQPAGDRTYESELDNVREKNDDSRVILEAALDRAKGTLNELRISDNEAKPLMDYSIDNDVKQEKKFTEANDKAKDDTDFWDKYIGIQMTNDKTTITNNTQVSQLISNYDSRKDFVVQNASKRKTAFLDNINLLKDADAMLYHIYRTAGLDKRELIKEEQQQVIDINSSRIRLLAQLKTEDQFTPEEWDEEGRYEAFQVSRDRDSNETRYQCPACKRWCSPDAEDNKCPRCGWRPGREKD